MITSTIEIIKINASEGMMLINDEGIIGEEVYLGANDSPDNWREITKEEAQEIEAQKNIIEE